MKRASKKIEELEAGENLEAGEKFEVDEKLVNKKSRMKSVTETSFFM